MKSTFIILLLFIKYKEASSPIECALTALSNNKKYYIVNNNQCQMPMGSSSSDGLRLTQRIYSSINNNVTLFRIVSGSGVEAADFFLSSGGFNGSVFDKDGNKSVNFKSSLLEEWNYTIPSIMNVTLQDNNYNTAAWLTFKVNSGDTSQSWFSLVNLINCYPWQINLVKSQTYKFFSIIGSRGKDGDKRDFEISCNYGGCNLTNGMLRLYGAEDGCAYGAGLSSQFNIPRIFYIISNGGCGIINNNLIEVKSLEIRATYDSSVKIMNY